MATDRPEGRDIAATQAPNKGTCLICPCLKAGAVLRGSVTLTLDGQARTIDIRYLEIERFSTGRLHPEKHGT